MTATERIVGVFIGEWSNDPYSILYGEEGIEYLCSRNDDHSWAIVSIKGIDGQEMVLATPAPAPDPLEVAKLFLDAGDQFV